MGAEHSATFTLTIEFDLNTFELQARLDNKGITGDALMHEAMIATEQERNDLVASMKLWMLTRLD